MALATSAASAHARASVPAHTSMETPGRSLRASSLRPPERRTRTSSAGNGSSAEPSGACPALTATPSAATSLARTSAWTLSILAS